MAQNVASSECAFYLNETQTFLEAKMLTATILEDNKELANFELKAKPFIAGVGGFAGKSQVEIDGKKYSVTLSMIEI